MAKKRALITDLEENIFEETRLDDHPVESFVADHEARIIHLNIDKIKPNPDQPRKYFDQEALEGLAGSIKTRGLLQPIIVKKKKGNEFILVAGERRWRACQLAGLKKVQALVSNDNELEIAIIENVQREDLSPLEEAEGLQSLSDKFKYTHEQLAEIVSKSRTFITKSLSLNKLPDEIKAECATSHNYPKETLLQVVRQKNNAKMSALWQKIKEGELTVKETKEVVKRTKQKKKAQRSRAQLLIDASNRFIRQANALDPVEVEREDKEALADNLSLLAEQLQELLSRLSNG